MGKIPTIAIIAIVAVLIIGMCVAAAYFLVKPKREELTKLREDLAAEEAVVAQKAQAEKDKAEIDQKWLQAQEELAALRERKSIRISMHMPLLAMTALWYEFRDDLPLAIKRYFDSQGVTILEGASIAGPPLAPPTVPSTGFLQVPGNAPLNLRVSGSLGAIERLYRNLALLPRIATIGSLSLTGSGDQLTATVPLTLYILVEGAEAASPPPAPAAAAGPAGPGGGAEAGGPPTGPSGEEGGDKKDKKDEKADEKPAKDDSGGGGGDE
ncbi:MAG: hypothetical protein ABFE08_07830 [Armatimonadia bacterium]